MRVLEEREQVVKQQLDLDDQGHAHRFVVYSRTACRLKGFFSLARLFFSRNSRNGLDSTCPRAASMTAASWHKMVARSGSWTRAQAGHVAPSSARYSWTLARILLTLLTAVSDAHPPSKNCRGTP